VLPIFRKQGRGILINNASMVSKIPEPYFSAYVASKQAVRGFAQCLRQELSLEGAREVRVCTLMPAAIDTPFFQHSANYSGRALKPPPPVYPAERVARAMVACAECPRREFFVGGSARLFHGLFLLSSVLAERLVARIIDRTISSRARPYPAVTAAFRAFARGHLHIGRLDAPHRTASGTPGTGGGRRRPAFGPDGLESRRSRSGPGRGRPGPRPSRQNPGPRGFLSP
jgi:hypothetical protein